MERRDGAVVAVDGISNADIIITHIKTDVNNKSNIVWGHFCVLVVHLSTSSMLLLLLG